MQRCLSAGAAAVLQGVCAVHAQLGGACDSTLNRCIQFRRSCGACQRFVWHLVYACVMSQCGGGGCWHWSGLVWACPVPCCLVGVLKAGPPRHPSPSHSQPLALGLSGGGMGLRLTAAVTESTTRNYHNPHAPGAAYLVREGVVSHDHGVALRARKALCSEFRVARLA